MARPLISTFSGCGALEDSFFLPHTLVMARPTHFNFLKAKSSARSYILYMLKTCGKVTLDHIYETRTLTRNEFVSIGIVA